MAAAVAILAFLPVMRHLPHHYFGSSGGDMNLAYRHFIKFCYDAVRGGTIPLWNPHIFCGTPFLPSTSATLFYPPNALVLLLLPQPLSINVCLMLHAAMLACFCVFLARVRGCSNIAGLLAGIVVSQSSLLACRFVAGHFTIMCTVAWIPLLLAFQHRLLRAGPAHILPVGLVSALMFLAGHLQFAYYAALFLAANLVLTGLLVIDAGRPAWFARTVRDHLAAGAVAACLAAVELLPVLDTVRFSARNMSERDLAWLRFFSMPPEGFLSLVAPTVYGATQYVGRWFWWETCLHFGVIPLALCLAAIACRMRPRRQDPFPYLFLLAILLSTLSYLPGLAKLLYAVPGWTVFRGHAKIAGYAAVFGGILAAEGFDRIRAAGGGDRRALRTAVPVLAAVAAGTVLCSMLLDGDFWRSFCLSPQRDMDRLRPLRMDAPGFLPAVTSNAFRALLMGAGWALGGIAALLAIPRLRPPAAAILLVAVVAAESLFFSVPRFAHSFDAALKQVPAPVATVFAGDFGKGRCDAPEMGLMNEGISFGFESPGGNDVLISRYYDTYLAVVAGQLPAHPNLTFRFSPEQVIDNPPLDAGNLLHVMASSRFAAAAQGRPLSVERDFGGIKIMRRTGALPRAYVVGSARTVPDNEREIAVAMLNGVDYRREVLLAGPVEDALQQPGFEAVPAAVEYRGLHEARVRAPAAGWLVLADAYYPNWKASIGGRPVEIRRANAAFRAVRVNNGDEVVFRYSHPVFALGAGVSAVSVLLAAAWSAMRLLRRPVHGSPDMPAHGVTES